MSSSCGVFVCRHGGGADSGNIGVVTVSWYHGGDDSFVVATGVCSTVIVGTLFGGYYY